MRTELFKIAYGEEDANKIIKAAKPRLVRRDIMHDNNRRQYNNLNVYQKLLTPKPQPNGPYGIGARPTNYTGAEADAIKATPDNMFKKVYMKGDVLPALRRIGDQAEKSYGAAKFNPGNLSPAERKALNVTSLAHEAEEVKHLSNPSKPRTPIGTALGHHSVAQILGSESNRLATASDPATKGGGEVLRKIRDATGEGNIYNNVIALRDKDGDAPFRYGENKVNRSHRKALYKKEMGLAPEELMALNAKGEMQSKLAKTKKREESLSPTNGFKKQLRSQDNTPKKTLNTAKDSTGKARSALRKTTDKMKSIIQKFKF